MTVRNFWINFFVLVITSLFCIFAGSFYTSTLSILLLPYCLFFILYVGVNYQNRNIKDKIRNRNIFLATMATIAYSSIYFYFIENTYKLINLEFQNEFHSSAEVKELINNPSISPMTIQRTKFLVSKAYILRISNGCVTASSPSYDMLKIHVVTCPTSAN